MSSFNHCLARLFQRCGGGGGTTNTTNSTTYDPPARPSSSYYSDADSHQYVDETSPMLRQVVAPCDMDEGYTFWVRTTTNTNTSLRDKVAVTVPRGGVRQGQVFWAAERTRIHSIRSFTTTTNATGSSSHSLDAIGMAAATTNPFITRSETSPLFRRNENTTSRRVVGRWKTPLIGGVFRQGWCHALRAFGCPQWMAAQVVTRLPPRTEDVKRNSGFCNTHNPSKSFLCAIAALFVLFWILSLGVLLSGLLVLFQQDTDHDIHTFTPSTTTTIISEDELQPSTILRATYLSVSSLLIVSTWYLLTILRTLVRHQYQIPPTTFACSCLPHHHHHQRSCCCYCCCRHHNDEEDDILLQDCCTSLFCGCCVASQLALQTATTEDGVVVARSRCCSPYRSMVDQGDHSQDDEVDDDNSTVAETISRSGSPSSLLVPVV